MRRRWDHVVFLELRRDSRVTTGISPKNTGVGSLFLLQRIFWTTGSLKFLLMWQVLNLHRGYLLEYMSFVMAINVCLCLTTLSGWHTIIDRVDQGDVLQDVQITQTS